MEFLQFGGFGQNRHLTGLHCENRQILHFTFYFPIPLAKHTLPLPSSICCVCLIFFFFPQTSLFQNQSILLPKDTEKPDFHLALPGSSLTAQPEWRGWVSIGVPPAPLLLLQPCSTSDEGIAPSGNGTCSGTAPCRLPPAKPAPCHVHLAKTWSNAEGL